MERLKALTDAINADHFQIDAEEHLGQEELSDLRALGDQIHCLVFVDSLVAIAKLAEEKKRPYRRHRPGATSL